MQALDIGMILCLRQDACDDAPLLRDAKAFLGAKRLYVDLAGHNQGSRW
jgi:hypothetical protein